ncbi:hypothetical protein LAG90_15605 [Marinilongibacter aquaticus]|uniref:hypothetical protein n=1 Tax=Marinilongibacter aquaticus TaxID=2975157 RepID=UPI0021BD5947|nr:hypothetical protein [Marinilongibacter aquaticus]UBM58229.1 hypothetical protein LAG90_15605 [Marinilongibacter aquaticus]
MKNVILATFFGLFLLSNFAAAQYDWQVNEKQFTDETGDTKTVSAISVRVVNSIEIDTVQNKDFTLYIAFKDSLGAVVAQRNVFTKDIKTDAIDSGATEAQADAQVKAIFQSLIFPPDHTTLRSSAGTLAGMYGYTLKPE